MSSPEPRAIAADRLLDGPIVLLDVGARGGVDPRWERFARYLSVLGFEPDPAECQRLNARAATDPSAPRFLPHALGREDRDGVPFYVCNWPVASSIYEPNAQFLAEFPDAAKLLGVRERREISTTTLDLVCREHGLQPDCLKVDVEGAELDVLIGGEDALRETLALDVEVEFQELFKGQPLFADVDSHLRERGWRLIGLRRNSWRRSPSGAARASGSGGQLVSADALYCNWGILEGLSPARAVKLAMVLAAHSQLDLALSVLERTTLPEISASELSELIELLAPRPKLGRRLATRLFGRVSSERRRAIADALEAGDASFWHDPNYF